MNRIGGVRFAIEMLKVGKVPGNLEEFLSELGDLDRFCLALRDPEATEFGSNSVSNRFAIRSGLLDTSATGYESAANIEGIPFTALFNFVATGQPIVFSKLVGRPDFIKIVEYTTELQTPPSIGEVYEVWKENPEVVTYIEPKFKSEWEWEMGRFFSVLGSGVLDTVVTAELVNKVFKMSMQGKSRDEVLEEVRRVLDLCASNEIAINNSELIDYAVIQCFGGECDGESNCEKENR